MILRAAISFNPMGRKSTAEKSTLILDSSMNESWNKWSLPYFLLVNFHFIGVASSNHIPRESRKLPFSAGKWKRPYTLIMKSGCGSWQNHYYEPNWAKNGSILMSAVTHFGFTWKCVTFLLDYYVLLALTKYIRRTNWV